MANRFKFQLLTGSDPQAQYDAITTKDDLTFYLLNTGVGYLGTVPLFGGGVQSTIVMTSGTLTAPVQDKMYALQNVTYGTDTLTGLYFYDGTNMTSFSDTMIAEYISNILVTTMTADGYTGDDNTVATTKAIMDLINTKLSDSSIVNAAFFRKVESHTLTAADLADPNIEVPTGAAEGDVGLLFLADTNDTDDGVEKYYFVNLANYVSNTYDAKSTDSIIMSLDATDNKFKADLNVAATETSILIGTDGVSLNKATTVSDGDGTDATNPAPAEDKLVTEKALVEYIQSKVLVAVDEAIKEALENVVTYDVDDGTTP